VQDEPEDEDDRQVEESEDENDINSNNENKFSEDGEVPEPPSVSVRKNLPVAPIRIAGWPPELLASLTYEPVSMV
jgi:hypothetical protein